LYISFFDTINYCWQFENRLITIKSGNHRSDFVCLFARFSYSEDFGFTELYFIF